MYWKLELPAHGWKPPVAPSSQSVIPKLNPWIWAMELVHFLSLQFHTCTPNRIMENKCRKKMSGGQIDFCNWVNSVQGEVRREYPDGGANQGKADLEPSFEMNGGFLHTHLEHLSFELFCLKWRGCRKVEDFFPQKVIHFFCQPWPQWKRKEKSKH